MLILRITYYKPPAIHHTNRCYLGAGFAGKRQDAQYRLPPADPELLDDRQLLDDGDQLA